MLNETEFRKALMEEKSMISDKDVFTSPPFFNYLNRLNRQLLKKDYVKLDFFWDEKLDSLAWTDGKAISINGGNGLSRSLLNKKLMALSYLGLDAHEVGHKLFSDFSIIKKYLENMGKQRFYPKKPEVSSQKDKEALDEIMFYFESREAAAITSAVMAGLAANINNAVEDAWMEGKMMERYPGSVKRGLALNSFRMMESTLSLKAMMEEEGFTPFTVIFNLILQYVRSGQVNNWEKISNEYTEFLYGVSDVLDEAVVEDDIKKRLDAVNLILVKLWGYMKEEIISTCWCAYCGNRMYIPRKGTRKRERRHIKTLYCLTCGKAVPAIELRSLL